MSAKKTVKKTAAEATKSNGNGKAGYKGHRAGSAKEKLHRLFDTLPPDKARAAALKLSPVATVNTSFSQFRKAAGSRAKA
jgi:hypothetical protein